MLLVSTTRVYGQQVINFAATCSASPSTGGSTLGTGLGTCLVLTVTPSVDNLVFTTLAAGISTSGHKQIIFVFNESSYVFTLMGVLIPPNTGLTAGWDQSTGTWYLISPSRPPNVYVVDGVTYPKIMDAYNDCVAASAATSPGYSCEIWDYNLWQGESMNAPPWNFDGTETPVHLHLGPGVLTVSGPFTVPRLSQVMGAGRAGSAGNAPNYGTVIRAASSAFGGIVITATGGTTHCASSGTVTYSGGTNSSAMASVAGLDANGNPIVVMSSMGYGYTTAPTSFTFPSSGGTCNAIGHAALVTTAVFIGDSGNSQGSTFGSRLENLTVDCSNVLSCSGIEIQNAQEQSGPRYVNVVNWASRGMFIHGIGAINSSVIDSEVDGCYPSPNCLISGASVGVEIDNTAVRVDKLTVNAVNTASFVPSSGTCATSNTIGLAGSFSTSLFNVNGYVLVSGVTGTPNVNGIYPISSNTSGLIKYLVPCTTGSYGVTSATVTILPLEAVSVCSGAGTACPDNATAGVTTSAVFTGIKHTERAFDGTFVSGPVSYTDINPTCPSAGITMTNCVHLAGGSNTPNSVAISNLLGGATNSIEDDSYSPPSPRLVTNVVVPQYTTSFGCPVNTSILAHQPQATVTPSSTSANEVALLTLAPPPSCQIPAGACLDLDIGFQHTSGTMPTDYAIVLSDSAGTVHVVSWLIAQQSSAAALYTFTARFCNNPGSQSTNSEWVTTLINGTTPGTAYFTLPAASGKGMFGTSGLVTTSTPIQLQLWIGPSQTSGSGAPCSYATNSATPFSACPQNWSGTDVYKAQFGRMVLVEQQ